MSEVNEKMDNLKSEIKSLEEQHQKVKKLIEEESD